MTTTAAETSTEWQISILGSRLAAVSGFTKVNGGGCRNRSFARLRGE